MGYSLIPEYWGKGLASELAVGGLHYFLENTSITEIYATTESPNIASQKVLLKAGFVFERTDMEEGKEVRIHVYKRGTTGSM